MEDGLKVGEKIYVSSRRLSEKYGYSIDHISRLCRKGRIKGKLELRTWFVDEEDFLTYTKWSGRNGNGHSKDSVSSDKKIETVVPVSTSPKTGKRDPEKRQASDYRFLGPLHNIALFFFILSVASSIFTAFHPLTRDSLADGVYSVARNVASIFPDDITMALHKGDNVGSGIAAAVLSGSGNNIPRQIIDPAAIYVYETISGFWKKEKAMPYVVKNWIRNKIVAWLDLDLGNIVYESVGVATSSKETIVRERVTERIIERVKEPKTLLVESSGVGAAELEMRLQQLNNDLRQEIFRVRGNENVANSVQTVFQAVAQSQRIDQLSNLTISNATITGSTISGYLPTSGGSLTGALALSATTTSSNGFDITDGCFAVDGVCVTGGGSAGGTDGQIQYNNGGSFGGGMDFIWDDGNNRLGIGTTSPYAKLSVVGEAVAAYFTATTSTASQFPYASSTALTVSGTASTSNLIASNNFTFKTVTGFLKATAGTVATAVIDLAADITGVLGVGNGGTGASTFGQGWLFSNGGTSALSASTSPTVNYLTATSTTATSTFAGGFAVETSGLVYDYSTNNVGIGTAVPTEKLEIGSLSTASNMFMRIINSGASVYSSGLKLMHAGTDYGFTIQSQDAVPQGLNILRHDNSATGVSALYIERVNGNVGLGTTSPYAKLTAWGDSTGKIFEAVTSASSTALSISATGFATTTLSGLNIAGSATSTSNVGINLSAGCFAINGTCVSGGAGTPGGSDGQVQYNNGGAFGGGTGFIWDDGTNRLGLGTTSPYAKLSIHANNGETNTTLFTIASSTASATTSLFTVLNSGNVGIGTVSPTNTIGFGGNSARTIAVERTTSGAGADLTIAAGDALGLDQVGGNLILASGKTTGSGGNSGSTGIQFQVQNLGNLNLPSDPSLNGVSTAMTINSRGYVGIGTTSPYTKLSVAGEVVAAYFTGTTTATSTLAGGLRIGTTGQPGALALLGNATSTAANGINLSAGCFAINGTCVSGGAGTPGGSDGQVQYNNGGAFGGGTGFIWDDGTNRLGLGTTSPYAKLSIHANNGETNTTLFTIASSTASATTSLFTVLNNGNVGVGRINPNHLLHVSGTSQTVDGNTIAIENTNNASGAGASFKAIVAGASGGNPFAHFTVTGQTDWAFGIDNADSDKFKISPDYILGNTSVGLTITTGGNLGVGTSSPYAKLSVVGPVVAEYFNATSTSATSTFAGGFSIAGGKFLHDYGAGVTSIETLDLGPISFDTNAGYVSWIDMPVTSSASSGTTEAYSAQIDSNALFTVWSQSDGAGSIKNTRVVVGTTTDTILGSTNIPYGSFIISDGALCVDDSGGSNCDDAARTRGSIYAESSTVTAIDLAENYPTKDQSLSAGEIIMLDPENPVFVSRYETGISTASSTTPVLLGVVSTKPGILLGGFGNVEYESERKIPVALSGRVPVKVNSENGPINVGDRIAPSSVPGIGMRSDKYGQTIGIALESFDGTDTGEILVFVDLVSQGLTVSGGTMEIAMGGNGIMDLEGKDLTNVSSISSALGTWSIDANGDLVVENVVVKGTAKVGSPERRTGITLYDEVDGTPYCLTISGGLTKTTSGECQSGGVGQTAAVVEAPEPTVEPTTNDPQPTTEPAATTTEPIPDPISEPAPEPVPEPIVTPEPTATTTPQTP